jgi:gluconokinase
MLNVIVVMGVSGAGKTYVGQALAKSLAWPFYEGDDYHPSANIEKMAHGIALTDADRVPWLEAIHTLIADTVASGSHAIVACSALKHSYRVQLVDGLPSGAVRFVFLDVPPEILKERIRRRKGHFVPPALLPSQLATLEIPRNALRVDGTLPVTDIVRLIGTEFRI